MSSQKRQRPLLTISGINQTEDRAEIISHVKELKVVKKFPQRLCFSVAVTCMEEIPTTQFSIFAIKTRALYMIEYENHINQKTITHDISKLLKANSFVTVIQIDVPDLDEEILQLLYQSHNPKVLFAIKITLTESSSVKDIIESIEAYKSFISFVSLYPSNSIEKVDFRRKSLTIAKNIQKKYKKVSVTIGGIADHDIPTCKKILQANYGLAIKAKKTNDNNVPTELAVKMTITSFFEKD